MRIMALDVGDKRIGLAVSDALGITAQGLPTLERGTLRKDLRIIKALIQKNEVSRIVVGWPRNMDGTVGMQAEKTRVFANALSEEASVPVEYWDERLTSKQAERVMIEADVSRADRRAVVDQLAAMLILTNWLDAHPSKTGNT